MQLTRHMQPDTFSHTQTHTRMHAYVHGFEYVCTGTYTHKKYEALKLKI